MGVAALLHDAAPTVSIEVYPPRSPAGERSLKRTLDHLVERVDFVSVTHGAAGSARETTREVVRDVLARGEVPVVAHLTCLGAGARALRREVGGLLDDGVRDLLALRGDTHEGPPDPDGLQRADQLVTLLRRIEEERFDRRVLSIGVAAAPGGLRHVPDPWAYGDLQALRAKRAAGADLGFTQVFFDVEDYTRYVDSARELGVDIPVVAGLVPLTDPRRLRRLEELTGVPVPARVLDVLDRETDDARRHAAGTAMGTELVEQVLAAGAPGVHLYTFNQHAAAGDLVDVVRVAPAAR
ncbi:5,10-methylenetetrahydrofolate reductase [Cellulomonas bogoriensis 69B4 = DSM 16987]|uniref:Methylenetetrahydrofolate reductase n=1 Tax=Cellulomonas bogoriensis 69B4 = DSM 16987 TaxID=1386082 RepID=A0A0A0C0R6_9CELL|nr:5,10-methylenetetrahydrofolate reductase [Cellulomonas bogoriensis 69B4 = DSM 16987]